MIYQMELMFGKEEIQKRVDFKINRLKERIDKSNTEKV